MPGHGGHHHGGHHHGGHHHGGHHHGGHHHGGHHHGGHHHGPRTPYYGGCCGCLLSVAGILAAVITVVCLLF